ncbi:hypothetical protein CHUAL_010650 [Chamberlinius hualienensis]
MKLHSVLAVYILLACGMWNLLSVESYVAKRQLEDPCASNCQSIQILVCASNNKTYNDLCAFQCATSTDPSKFVNIILNILN